ncbi:MAG: hypothetical protein KGS72_20190 [Cyanobacteria bacterium REEB67]|nr:hypothetical protein [Cyanobacteria bacterium REEB67]
MQILNNIRKTSHNLTSKRALLWLRVSYLLCIVIWFLNFYVTTCHHGDIIAKQTAAVSASALTFEFVAAGLTLCLIQFVMACRRVAGRLPQPRRLTPPDFDQF